MPTPFKDSYEKLNEHVGGDSLLPASDHAPDPDAQQRLRQQARAHVAKATMATASDSSSSSSSSAPADKDDGSITLIGLLRFRASTYGAHSSYHPHGLGSSSSEHVSSNNDRNAPQGVTFELEPFPMTYLFSPWSVSVRTPNPNTGFLCMLLFCLLFAVWKLRRSNYHLHFGSGIAAQQRDQAVAERAMADQVEAKRVLYREQHFQRQNPGVPVFVPNVAGQFVSSIPAHAYFSPRRNLHPQQQQQQQQQQMPPHLAAAYDNANTVPWYRRVSNFFSASSSQHQQQQQQMMMMMPDDRRLAQLMQSHYHLNPNVRLEHGTNYDGSPRSGRNNNNQDQQNSRQNVPYNLSPSRLMRWTDGEDAFQPPPQQNAAAYYQQPPPQQQQPYPHYGWGPNAGYHGYPTTHSQQQQHHHNNGGWGWAQQQQNNNNGWGNQNQQQQQQQQPQQNQYRSGTQPINNSSRPPMNQNINNSMMFPRQDFNTTSATMSNRNTNTATTTTTASANNNNRYSSGSTFDCLSPMNNSTNNNNGNRGGNGNIGSGTPLPGTSGRGMVQGNENADPRAAAQAVKEEAAAKAANRPENFDQQTGRPLSVRERLQQRAQQAAQAKN